MEKVSFVGGRGRNGGVTMPPMFPGTAMQLYLANCDVDEFLQPSTAVSEAYARYLHLPELSRLQKTRTWPGWSNEPLLRPALHSLEMVFRMISSVFFDTREYIDSDEWLRRLEALANSQLELISFICEGDYNAPMTKQSSCASPSGSGPGGWPKAGSRATPFRSSQESLLTRMATWKKAQSTVTRLHFAIEAHMLRVPFTLGLGEPNLSGKPVLEYDKICTPLDVYSLRQADPGCPEDHALSTAHQMLEAWLVVAQGMVKSIEETVLSGDVEVAAKKCWFLERVWKLFTNTVDLLQVMDPDDFMRLNKELSLKSGVRKGFAASGAAYCLRSNMMRTVTKACKELRDLVPKAVGVEADPKGGPRLQEAIMELFNSHGHRTVGYLAGQPYAYHTGTIHLLQAFQSVEAAIRQFYFTYQHLVIIAMGSGEYKGTTQSEVSGGDALSQLYSEPPYFPSVDGARTFLGNFWHHHTAIEEGLRQVGEKGSKSSKTSSLCSTSTNDSEDDMLCSGPHETDYQRAQRQMFEEATQTASRAFQQSGLRNHSNHTIEA